jgi:hypothetical protein
MKRIENREIHDVTLDIDDTEFINCQFTNCTLVYSGGPCVFQSHGENCRLQMKGAAANTFDLLQDLGMFDDTMEPTFDSKKAPKEHIQ